MTTPAPRTSTSLLAALLLAAALVLVPSVASSAGGQEATTSYTPIAELYGLRAGFAGACAIDDNDELYCWGSDVDGQLGDGPATDDALSPKPVAVAGTPLAGKAIAQVEHGYTHACARTTDQVVACWGENSSGELGDGTTTDRDVPVAVAVSGTPLAGKAIADIDLGVSHSCALATDGTVACWGNGGIGQLGTGAGSSSSVPVAFATAGTPLDGLTIDTLAVGGFNTCAMSTTNVLACSGVGTGGVLGRGSTTLSMLAVSPTRTGTALEGKTIDLLDVGRYNVCVTTTDDDLVCWGNNDDGAVGDGTTTDRLVPTAVATAGTPLDGKAISQIATGMEHACVRTIDQVLACWGQGSSGELGNGSSTSSSVPVGVQVAGTRLEGLDIDEVAAGDGFSCATNQGAQPACWGAGNLGQLGDGTGQFANTPRPVVLTPSVPSAPTLTLAADDGDGEARVEWTAPASDGGAPLTGYRVDIYLDGSATVYDSATAGQAQTSQTLPLPTDATYRFRVVALNIAGESPPSALSDPVYLDPGNPQPEIDGAFYVPIVPCRIVDTRQAGGALADREIRDVAVRGDGSAFAAQGGKANGCDLPLDATAVEASVTAVDPADSGFFRAWPSGESMPNATFMNFDRGMDITNTGSLSLGPAVPESGATTSATQGDLRIRSFGGASHYVIDVQGYVTEELPRPVPNGATTSALEVGPSYYTAITPCRIVDTRQAGGALGNREIRDLAVAGDGPRFAAQGGTADGCGLPPGALAVEASITAVDPADSGFFRAWPSGESMPNATFMNFDRGMDITNTGSVTIRPLDQVTGSAATNASADQMRIRNFGGASHYVVDVQGYWRALDGDAEGAAATTSAVDRPSLYQPMVPCRVVDTRQAGGALADREIRDVSVTSGPRVEDQGGRDGGCGIPLGTVAVEASITAVDPADSGFFRAWPSGQSMPNATFMNFDRGMDITNTGSVTIAVDEATQSIATTHARGDELRIRNFGGASHYVIDIQGYYPGIGAAPSD